MKKKTNGHSKLVEQKIIPHLWFDYQTEEAVSFYTSLFENSKIANTTRYGKAGQEIHEQKPGTVMTVDFELAGQKFIALNGGPHFSFTPAISFMVICETEEEVNNLWHKLSAGGEILMPLDSYEWSDRYGWTEDRFGLSWQLYRGDIEAVGQKIVPSLMFISETGRAEEAINFYTSLFKNSEIEGILRYEEEEEQPTDTVKHAQFRLNDEVFMAMDSLPVHDFGFNEAISLLIQCETQEEIDHFWNNLSAVPEAEQCGWLKDQNGVSWQVVPAVLPEMLLDSDPGKVERVTDAFMQMKKLDIVKLEEACKGKIISKNT